MTIFLFHQTFRSFFLVDFYGILPLTNVNTLILSYLTINFSNKKKIWKQIVTADADGLISSLCDAESPDRFRFSPTIPGYGRRPKPR